jgi:hypothetical protein
MQVYYADAGLLGYSGHHAEQCRAVVEELGARGIGTAVLGFAGLEPALKSALQAEPFFRWYRYQLSDGDPDRGWVTAFERGAQATREDLARLHTIGADDILYLVSASAIQLMGAALWMGDLAPARVPHVVVHFGMDPGVDARPTPAGGVKVTPRDPRVDPSATLCRLAGTRMRDLDRARLHIGYILANGAKVYAALLDHPVDTVPAWEQATTDCRSRVGKRPIVAAVLGHQRNPDKGYHLVPEIVHGLLQSHPDVQFVAHNSNPEDMAEAQQALRALAATEPRVRLVERAVDPAGWRALLEAVDLVICPYSPRRYQLLSSGLHFQALANAIPSVVPAGTSLADLADALGGSATTFMRNDAVSVLEAARRALDRYDHYAALASAAAARWPERHGRRRFVDALLAAAGR